MCDKVNEAEGEECDGGEGRVGEKRRERCKLCVSVGSSCLRILCCLHVVNDASVFICISISIFIIMIIIVLLLYP